ncbi:hypothetical protein DCAR_0934596 [Daucus carota subsp. sativus]|uniref:Uncharacterized protein n=1 Tax=Daucus carota subsp. sativus TaxID=79200 RepID=A0AAF0XX69_DAUCS|nr:hypothetical protein DCAR_0934596 [Daucus carota subsp. sativus]
MLIMDELPFMFVEREGFRLFCKAMHPEFLIPSLICASQLILLMMLFSLWLYLLIDVACCIS